MKGYADRFAKFAGRSPLFRELAIEDRRSPSVVFHHYSMGVYRRERESCDCCGNTQLARRFPIRSDDGQLFMIGWRCLEKLEEMGKLAEREITEETIYRKESA